MQKNSNSLKEWTLTYIKNIDLFYRKIETIKEEGKKLVVTNKNSGVVIYFIEEDLSNFNPANISDEKQKYIIVTYNKKSNIEALIKIWDRLIKFKMLNVLFTNPQTSAENKWFINPYHHSKINDTNLKTSLISIFMTTTPYID